MGRTRRNLAGQRFGRLVAVFLLNTVGQSKWECLCDCGTRKGIVATSLVGGLSRSCGCTTRQPRNSTDAVFTDDKGEYCEIALTQGLFAKIDPADYPEISRYNWQAWWNKSTRSFYAKRSAMVSEGGISRTVYMHRMVLGLQSGGPRVHSGHIGHDTLDNRRKNLRPATPQQNLWNSRDKICGNATGYRGVVELPNGKFKSGVRTASGRRVWSRQVDTAKEAHADYLELVKKHHGEFAYAAA